MHQPQSEHLNIGHLCKDGNLQKHINSGTEVRIRSRWKQLSEYSHQSGCIPYKMIEKSIEKVISIR